jgi:hypothetical protein
LAASACSRNPWRRNVSAIGATAPVLTVPADATTATGSTPD